MEQTEKVYKKKNVWFLLFVFVFFIVLIGVLNYYSAKTKNINISALQLSLPQKQIDLTNEQKQELQKALEGIESGLMQSNKFKYMQKQDGLPVEIGQIGKSNPFSELQ